MRERTLSIVKPDAVQRGATGEILQRFEAAGLEIIALKKLRMSFELARGFYAVHRERPFYGDLVKFMCSGPVVVSVLQALRRSCFLTARRCRCSSWLRWIARI